MSAARPKSNFTRILPPLPPAFEKSGRPRSGAVSDISPHERFAVARFHMHQPVSPPHILALLAIQFSKSLFCARLRPQNNRCPTTLHLAGPVGHRALGVLENPERSMPNQLSGCRVFRVMAQPQLQAARAANSSNQSRPATHFPVSFFKQLRSSTTPTICCGLLTVSNSPTHVKRRLQKILRRLTLFVTRLATTFTKHHLKPAPRSHQGRVRVASIGNNARKL